MRGGNGAFPDRVGGGFDIIHYIIASVFNDQCSVFRGDNLISFSADFGWGGHPHNKTTRFDNTAVDGQQFKYFSGALDVVAHELAHGLTDFTSGLLLVGDSGALNEAFSDIIAIGTEFYSEPFYQGTAGTADYLIGEDITSTGGMRSLANPQQFGHPDHYSLKIQGTLDNGGVHANSLIASHAFYLAIEGGTNRVSGLQVQGVGSRNREIIEKVFYRAFTMLLTRDADFSTARAATIQSALDLYGAGSHAARTVSQAWTAVGVN